MLDGDKKKALLLIFFLLFACFPVVFAPSGFSYYVELTIDSADIDEDLTDFPVLVALSNSSGKTGFDATPIFDEIGDTYNSTAYTVKGDSLYFEVEYWNASELSAFVWVKIPSISSTENTTLTLWFTQYADGSAYNVPVNVWDSNFVMVQHMNDATTSTILDSTNNDNDGTKASANNPLEANGIIGKAQDFSNDVITVTHNGVLNTTTAITVEFWVNNPAFPASQGILSKQYGVNPYWTLFFIGVFGRIQWEVRDGGGVYDTLLSTVLVAGTDYHITLVQTAFTATFYVNGVAGTPKVLSQSIDETNSASNLLIGKLNAGFPITGVIDETRISVDVARSVAWVGASYETQKDNLFSYGLVSIYDSSVTALGFGVIALIIAVFAFIFVISKK